MPNTFRNKKWSIFITYLVIMLIYLFGHPVNWTADFAKKCIEIKTACPDKHLGPNFRVFWKKKKKSVRFLEIYFCFCSGWLLFNKMFVRIIVFLKLFRSFASYSKRKKYHFLFSITWRNANSVISSETDY